MTETLIRIPTLETERLRLRAAAPGDFEAYAAFRAEPRTQVLGGPHSRSDAFQMLAALVGQWQLRGYGRWIIADRTDDRPLGVTGIFHPEDWPEAELAWSLFGAAEGKGIAQEAALAARDFAYATLKLPPLISMITAGNTRSEALARRLGARIERDYQHPEFGDMRIWRHPSREDLA
ncbi:MAG: GNAT family N-acetyltransferase [Pseudomonadota bacterium]